MPTRTAARKITEDDLRSIFDDLTTAWAIVRHEAQKPPVGYKLVKVSGTARYDHWGIQETHGHRAESIGVYVTGFDNMGSIAASYALMRAALVSVRMAR